jgi:hypothetical protein
MSKVEDNRWVRRLLAAVVLVLFASLNAMDGICCPDGCTHEQQSPSQQHRSESSDGTCMLCLGGVNSSVQQDLSRSDVVTDSVGLPPLAHHLDAPPDRVEHPPRS